MLRGRLTLEIAPYDPWPPRLQLAHSLAVPGQLHTIVADDSELDPTERSSLQGFDIQLLRLGESEMMPL